MQEIAVALVMDKRIFINYSSFSDFGLKNSVVLV